MSNSDVSPSDLFRQKGGEILNGFPCIHSRVSSTSQGEQGRHPLRRVKAFAGKPRPQAGEGAAGRERRDRDASNAESGEEGGEKISPARSRVAGAKAAPKPAKQAAAAPPDIAVVLSELERNGSSKVRADMAARYGIVTRDPAYGTPMAQIKLIARKLGHDHELAEALWKTGVYETRLLASMVDDPERVTPAQMNRWAKDFDNWALVDTLCFNLFDRTACAFAQITSWSSSKHELIKRAAFALLASAALHGHGTDDDFVRALPLIQLASGDERNFVKKGVSWALRAVGGKKSPKLRAAARALAQQLAKAKEPSARWIGKDALRAFAKA